MIANNTPINNNVDSKLFAKALQDHVYKLRLDKMFESVSTPNSRLAEQDYIMAQPTPFKHLWDGVYTEVRDNYNYDYSTVMDWGGCQFRYFRALNLSYFKTAKKTEAISRIVYSAIVEKMPYAIITNNYDLVDNTETILLELVEPAENTYTLYLSYPNVIVNYGKLVRTETISKIGLRPFVLDEEQQQIFKALWLIKHTYNASSTKRKTQNYLQKQDWRQELNQAKLIITADKIEVVFENDDLKELVHLSVIQTLLKSWYRCSEEFVAYALKNGGSVSQLPDD